MGRVVLGNPLRDIFDHGVEISEPVEVLMLARVLLLVHIREVPFDKNVQVLMLE